jgi:hypothetical protein
VDFEWITLHIHGVLENTWGYNGIIYDTKISMICPYEKYCAVFSLNITMKLITVINMCLN